MSMTPAEQIGALIKERDALLVEVATWRSMPEWLQAFVRRMAERAAAGAIEYGDRSHNRPVVDLLGEVEEEVIDQAVWGAICHHRIARLLSCGYCE